MFFRYKVLFYLHPFAFFPVGEVAGDEGVESGRVVRYAEVAEFMNDDILAKGERLAGELEVEGHDACQRTAVAPLRFHVT